MQPRLVFPVDGPVTACCVKGQSVWLGGKFLKKFSLDGKLEDSQTLRAPATFVLCDGDDVFAGSEITVSRIGKWNVRLPSPVLCASVDAGKILAIGCSDSVIRLLNPTSGEQIRELGGHRGPVRGLLNVGKSLISCSDDCYLVKWNPTSGDSKILYGGFRHPLTTMCYHSKNIFFGEGQLVRSFVLEFGVLGKDSTHTPHTSPVISIASDSNYLFSASADAICIWQNETALKTFAPSSPFDSLCVGSGVLIAPPVQWSIASLLGKQSNYDRLPDASPPPPVSSTNSSSGLRTVSGPLKLKVVSSGAFRKAVKWNSVWVDVDGQHLNVRNPKKRDAPGDSFPLMRSHVTETDTHFTFHPAGGSPLEFEVDSDSPPVCDWVRTVKDLTCRLEEDVSGQLIAKGRETLPWADVKAIVDGCFGLTDDAALKKAITKPIADADCFSRPLNMEQQANDLVHFQEFCAEQIMRLCNASFPKISPSFVDFGGKRHPVGAKASVPVRIRNTGTKPLEVAVSASQITVSPDHATVAAGSETKVTLTMSLDCTKVAREMVKFSFAETCNVHIPVLFETELSKNIAFEEIKFGDQLGRGRFGTVFKSDYRGKLVAVKAIPLQEDFEQERNLLSRLPDHPNIVVCVGFCQRLPFQGFIAFELAPYGSLDTLIYDTNQAITPHLSLRITRDCAEALAFLHQHKVFHLDLKPQNILVFDRASVPVSVVAKLCDFGISRQLDSTETFKGSQVEGTVLYMSPEMLGSKTFTQKADIYSFGVCIYELITRLQPYAGEKYEKMSRWDFENAKIAGEMPGDVPPGHPLSDILKKSLLLNHKARPTAAEIVESLKGVNVTSLPADVVLTEASVRMRTQRMQRAKNVADRKPQGQYESVRPIGAVAGGGASRSNIYESFNAPLSSAGALPAMRPPGGVPSSQQRYDSVDSVIRNSGYERVQANQRPASSMYDKVVQPSAAMPAYDVVSAPPGYTRPAPPGPRPPSKSDYINKPWYKAEMNRTSAENWLRSSKPAGTFLLRPSSQVGCLSISHVENDGSIGHGIVHLHQGPARVGWSIENSKRTYDTVEALLRALPGLRLFDYGL